MIVLTMKGGQTKRPTKNKNEKTKKQKGERQYSKTFSELIEKTDLKWLSVWHMCSINGS